MPITVTCDRCSKSHRVRDDAVGKQIVCKGCGKSLTVAAQASVNLDFDDQPTCPGVSLEVTRQGWRLTASLWSPFVGVAFLVIGVIVLVGLQSSIVRNPSQPGDE